eukprot:scaffold1785_cov247-Pinguiococcus_pyrenoidosus.AAC.28
MRRDPFVSNRLRRSSPGSVLLRRALPQRRIRHGAEASGSHRKRLEATLALRALLREWRGRPR